jgi:hypothetical protein
MTTDELILALRELANNVNPELLHAAADRIESLVKLLGEVAEKLEENDKIIRRYEQAYAFLASHGWKCGDENESK